VNLLRPVLASSACLPRESPPRSGRADESFRDLPRHPAIRWKRAARSVNSAMASSW
jgi:hypothetical protein